MIYRIGLRCQCRFGAANLYFPRHFEISKAAKAEMLIILLILTGVVFAQKKYTGFEAGRALKGFPNGSPSILTGACVSTHRQLRLNS